MVAQSVPSQVGAPANAFARPLRLLPRRLRLAALIGYRSIAGFYRHNGLTWAASMAFWLTLSVPPLLIALTSVAQQVLGQETAQQLIADQVAAQLPAEGSIVSSIVQQEIPVFSVAGMASLAFLLFSGSRIFGALVGAIDAMWQHVEDTGLIGRQLLRLVMVLVVGGLLLLSVLLQLGILGARDEIGLAADILARNVLPFLLVVGGLAATYGLLPRGKPTWRTALVAAILTAVLLRIAQFVFWYLLTGMLDFSTAYGPLAGVAILMTWAIVASAIVLIGAQFVAVLDRHRISALPLPSSATGDFGERNETSEAHEAA
jgi:YihY family inner membrane protein